MNKKERIEITPEALLSLREVDKPDTPIFEKYEGYSLILGEQIRGFITKDYASFINLIYLPPSKFLLQESSSFIEIPNKVKDLDTLITLIEVIFHKKIVIASKPVKKFVQLSLF